MMLLTRGKRLVGGPSETGIMYVHRVKRGIVTPIMLPPRVEIQPIDNFFTLWNPTLWILTWIVDYLDY